VSPSAEEGPGLGDQSRTPA